MKLGREVINDCAVVCDMRHTYILSCRDCKYKGNICDMVKRRFKLEKPYEIMDKNEFEERYGFYYD